MKLSRRLSLLRSYQANTSSIWDIGCDHALLGLSFLNEDSVSQIHLVDPSVLVIENLKPKLQDAYITKKAFKIHIHQQRGQDVVLNSASKTIFIAGMGGEEIRQILMALLPQLTCSDQVVISPHRKILQLRGYLTNSPFRLFKEEVTIENDQYYQVLGLSLDPQFRSVSLFGEALFQDEIGQGYRMHQLGHFKGHKDLESMAYFAYLKKISLKSVL